MVNKSIRQNYFLQDEQFFGMLFDIFQGENKFGGTSVAMYTELDLGGRNSKMKATCRYP